jgi:hypothetical protein
MILLQKQQINPSGERNKTELEIICCNFYGAHNNNRVELWVFILLFIT